MFTDSFIFRGDGGSIVPLELVTAVGRVKFNLFFDMFFAMSYVKKRMFTQYEKIQFLSGTYPIFVSTNLLRLDHKRSLVHNSGKYKCDKHDTKKVVVTPLITSVT